MAIFPSANAPRPAAYISFMTRSAQAVWFGSLKEGHGVVTTESKTHDEAQYSFKSRFETGTGTNPEELIAAAHAGCFSMAFGAQMGERGITPDSVDTTSEVTMLNLAVTKSALKTVVKAPGADKAKIEEAAAAAKTGCPISKVLNCEITLDLTIEA
jgi:osmotically inducible protein OsmC